MLITGVRWPAVSGPTVAIFVCRRFDEAFSWEEFVLLCVFTDLPWFYLTSDRILMSLTSLEALWPRWHLVRAIECHSFEGLFSSCSIHSINYWLFFCLKSTCFFSAIFFCSVCLDILYPLSSCLPAVVLFAFCYNVFPPTSHLYLLSDIATYLVASDLLPLPGL